MGAPFRDARLKVGRADEHIRNLEAAIAALEEAADAAIHEDANTGTEFVKHEYPHLADGLLQLSLIAADALHNLRAALDYAWASVIQRCVPTAVSDHNTFPVRDTRNGVEAALHGIEVDTKCPRLFSAVIDGIKPYSGGNQGSVHALHNIDISDKHILLLELTPITGIRDFALRDESGQIYDGISIQFQFLAGAPHAEPHKAHILRAARGMKIEKKGKFSLIVTIKEAGVFKGVPILDLLNHFREVVFRCVEVLESV